MKHLYQVFGQSKQGYHQRIKRENVLSDTNATILAMVSAFRKTHPRTGTCKLKVYLEDDLNRACIKIGRTALYTLLRDNHLLVKKTKRFHITKFQSLLLQISEFFERASINAQ